MGKILFNVIIVGKNDQFIAYHQVGKNLILIFHNQTWSWKMTKKTVNFRKSHKIYVEPN